MTKVAALYDIHGNLPALEAVLDELQSVEPDAIVIGGDTVEGPMPHQTMARISDLGAKAHWIRGNGDRDLVLAYDGKPLPSVFSERAREQIEWATSKITNAERDFLAGLPLQFSLDVDDLGQVLFCHATPQSEDEIFTAATPDDRLLRIFSTVERGIVVCGHTHSQFDRQLSNGLRILNAGSVGMPFADQPGAYWLLLDQTGYTFRRTAYDAEAAGRTIKASGYPFADEFVERNVVNIPTMEEASALFERIANERWSQESR